MKFITPNVQLIKQEPGLEGVFKMIEKAARICYASESGLTTPEQFIEGLKKSNHTSPLAFGTIYMYIQISSLIQDIDYTDKMDLKNKYKVNPYSHVEIIPCKDNATLNVYITTNYRVIHDNNWYDDLKYMCEPTEYHEKRYTFKIDTSIAVSREINRHTRNSIAEQSTRYCNYSKDKFGNELKFIKPSWYNNSEIDFRDDVIKILQQAEESYIRGIHMGLQPQQVRDLLPLCTATKLMHCAFAKDWKHFFDLRYFDKTGKAHPDCKEIASQMYNLISNKLYD